MSRRGQVALAAGVGFLALVCAAGAGRPGVVAAQAKAYSWVDASGRLRISDRPPPTGADEADVVVIRRGNGLGGPDGVSRVSLPPEEAGGAGEPWAEPPTDGETTFEGIEAPGATEGAASEDDAERPVAPRRVVNLRGRGGADAAAEATGDNPMDPAPDEEGLSVEGESPAGDDAQAEASADAKPPAADEADAAGEAEEAEEVSPQPRSVEERIRAWRRRAAEARRGAASSTAEEGAPATRSQRRRGAEQPEDDDPEGVEGEEAPRPWWEL